MKLINLIPLKEIDFPSQGAFDTYSKAHKLRPDTKVKIAGKTTTAGQASKVKGTSVFSKDNTKNIFHKQDKPKDLESSVTNHLNKISGGKGYTQKDEGGAIAYNMGTGDEPTYTLYMGKEGSKHRITLEPTYGNDPAKLQGKIDKSFDKAEDAIKFMGDVAKKHRRELEMDDNKKSDDKSGDYPAGSLQYRLQKNNPKDAVKYDFYNAGETLRQMGWKPDDIAKRIGDNLPYMDDEKDIPMMKNSDDKEDWINLYKKSIAMKKAGYSSSEIADKLRANL